MPANKINYLVLYVGDSQIYGSADKNIALQTPPPSGIPLENKRIMFVTFEPDNETLTVHPLPIEEVMGAELKYPKPKESK